MLPYIWHKNKLSISETEDHTNSQTWWWQCGGLALLEKLNDLPPEKSWTRISSHPFVTLNSFALELLNRTKFTSKSTLGMAKTCSMFQCGLVKVQTELLGNALKQSAHAKRKPWHVAELRQFYKEERLKSPPRRCEKLTSSECNTAFRGRQRLYSIFSDGFRKCLSLNKLSRNLKIWFDDQ